ncbi:DNA-binding response regulator [Bradyrhizobium sp. SSBR45G]|uniref:response regulator transcription factor n=1 Tax=unclassified Bradyrhizobium TaxID=2631580 RepID=UPI002342A35B|nr:MULTISPECIES: response regulator [unclassified Bradyrhizobium]GLH77177.1 DNA-binding response regulator [Bradyrhizobium sp. SSBR45G]GLH83935.1 DNA-binding response regulator [Bradyrhizobium sp. SSBR45R]
MPVTDRALPPLVAVVDDDEGVREALRGLFESVELAVEAFGSVRDYMASECRSRASCLVLDIRLPGQSGLEFQDALIRASEFTPIVIVSAHVDVAMAVRAMKNGAVDVLTKPVREQDLLEAINRALARKEQQRDDGGKLAELSARYATLTDRERQIMTLVVSGKLNKQIAAEIDVVEATVKLHRGHMMQKMKASSIVELVRMADALRNVG